MPDIIQRFADADEPTVRLLHSLLMDAEQHCLTCSNKLTLSALATMTADFQRVEWRTRYQRYLDLELRLIHEVINPRRLYGS